MIMHIINLKEYFINIFFHDFGCQFREGAALRVLYIYIYIAVASILYLNIYGKSS